MKTYTILLVEDDITLASTIAYNLEKRHWKTIIVHSYQEAKKHLYQDTQDITLLDVNLADGNGFDLCQTYREVSQKPIIFLTANDWECDEIKGYDLGADDYVTKPFSLAVLVRKIDVILKRTEIKHNTVYNDGYLFVDLDAMKITVQGKEVILSTLEFKALTLFIKNAGIVLTRQAVLEKLWDTNGNFVDESALNMMISRVRKKLKGIIENILKRYMD